MSLYGTVLIVAASGFAAAAQPRVENAAVSQHDGSAGLEGVIDPLTAAGAPAWIGFAMPASVRGDSCCFHSDGLTSCRGCFLEAQDRTVVRRLPESGPIPLEGADSVNVLLRVENGQIGRIRMFTPDCSLNGGGLAFHWISGLRAGDATRFLIRTVRDGRDRNVKKSAMRALSLSREPEALQYIDRLLAK
ncbi:MAG TPA: hypothetical protein VFL57_09605 [Bryobacteraceae bacterium]|nr:hypothetical protein [Bryobacteraceae bacterium]